MESFLAVVSKESYTIMAPNGEYIMDFTVQVDRSDYIFGELFVFFRCKNIMGFKVGERLKLQGRLYRDRCFILEATSIKRLPIYN